MAKRKEFVNPFDNMLAQGVPSASILSMLQGDSEQRDMTFRANANPMTNMAMFGNPAIQSMVSPLREYYRQLAEANPDYEFKRFGFDQSRGSHGIANDMRSSFNNQSGPAGMFGAGTGGSMASLMRQNTSNKTAKKKV